MSPRAAWQLEAMGFQDVYDFVGGKAEWIATGLPTEGAGPHYPLVGEAARRDIVHECRLGTSVGAAHRAVTESSQSFCVVLNDHDILIGRLRKKHLSSGDERRVEQVMESGPTTVRPTESAAALVKRMQPRDIPAMLVTTSQGRFVGVARRRDLDALVAAAEGQRFAGQERRR